MWTSITSFADEAVSFIAGSLEPFAQELVVLGVFLLSYGIWYSLGKFDQRKRAARKANDLSLCQGPKKPNVAPRAKAIDHTSTVQRRGSSDASTKALEAQMLKHLEQHEFTRALTLYRSLKPETCEHSFSEQFYTAFIESGVRVGKTDVVERLFNALRRSGLTPSGDFWRRVLKMLSSRKHFSTCLMAHSVFKHQLPTDKVVWSCLANAGLEVGDASRAASMLEQYSKCDLNIKDYVLFFRIYHALKDADSGEALFRRLGIRTTPLMLNLLLLTCVTKEEPKRALGLLEDAHGMEDNARQAEAETCKPESYTATVVDVVSYNTVIKGLAEAGTLTNCFECLRGMLSRGLQPDDITFATLMDACIEENVVGVISEIVNVSLEAKNQVSTVMYTLFIKGLVKANCLPKALELCDEMKRRAGARPDVITYSLLIKALVDQHDIERALLLVEDMRISGQSPDDIILTHLLEGCRFAGDHELGKKLFNEFLSSGVKPSEFTLLAMLKLCGRVGAHQEAHDLVAGWEMTYGCKPSVIHYTCLMSGCLRRKHYDFAWKAYELMTSSGVKPDSTTLSTLMPGMVAAQNWDCFLVLAKEALAPPMQHKVPAEILNSALVQMQAAEGYSRHAAQLRELMHAAGVPVAMRRRSQLAPHTLSGRPQPGVS